jgi:hypothetical protein
VRIFLSLLSVGVLVITAGCETTSGLYYWGNYEQSLYDYTKRPGEIDKYVESLGTIVAKGEEQDRVPPGLYAEYAYALMLAGRQDESVAFFDKERAKWPESDALIKVVLREDDAPKLDESLDSGQADAETEEL